MSHPTLNRYAPDTVTPPGFYIREKLEETGMTEASLAAAIGLADAGEILDGRAPIGPEVALGLELALGIPARFWNNAERQYRDGIKEGPGQDRESPQPNRHRRPAKWK